MSWQATAYVSALTITPSGDKLTRSEKLLLLCLANRHNHDYGIAWPSVRELSKDALLSLRMTRYLLKSLEQKGVIVRIRRMKGPKTYDTTGYRLPALDLQGGSATIASGRKSSGRGRASRIAEGHAPLDAPGHAMTLQEGHARAAASKQVVNDNEPAVNRGNGVSHEQRADLFGQTRTCSTGCGRALCPHQQSLCTYHSTPCPECHAAEAERA
jgi:Helix-turn-helix domain